ncbi:MAG: RHS repeat-associated core domain-containing protein [Sphaerochaetaceae bacterium]|nr:RHS repeat-associated core domain-containing protein [Sphaerochaetaceae bacterium]
MVNPFIYKGYYYDSETDWYYLKSRYYCSMLSRFINMDNTNYLEPGSMDGVDLFAYCGNNPVMYVDPSGNMSKFWKITLAVGIVSALVVGSVVTGGLLGAALVGAAVGGGISTVSQIATTGDINFAQLGLDITIGAISGVIGGSEVTRLTATAFGFVLGGVSNFSSQLIQTGSFTEINYGSVLTSAFIGGAAAFIGGAGARNKASIEKGSGVIKANNNVCKALGKMKQGNYYSSARYAQGAYTRTMNTLSKQVSNRITQTFAKSMSLNGIAGMLNNLISSQV